MSTTTSAELSLINDTEFLEELEQFDGGAGHPPDPSLEPPPTYDDAFDSLESGLAMDPGAPLNSAPHYDREPPIADPYNDPAAPPEAPGRTIPFMAAALVIVACLTAGAATAAFVFHDRLTSITGTRPASR